MRYLKFAERLQKAIKDEGLWGSQRAMAKIFHVSSSTMNSWLMGDKLPSHKTAIAICGKLGVTVEWLMTGNGPMRQEESVDVRYSRLPPDAQEFFMSTLEMLESKYRDSNKDNTPNNKD